LVVEDNPVNLELVTELLEQEGCEVLAAHSAEVGIQLAQAERPNLVLMDVELPGMTGYEATRRLKATPATASIPVLVLTSHAMRGEVAEAREVGCDAYLAKPLDTRAFREALRRLLPRQSGAG
jgi:CheY-like chemotaxis protein